MIGNQKSWNKNQKTFRSTLLAYERHAEAMEMFRIQHGQLHSKAISAGQTWSYADELIADLDESGWRSIPEGRIHSIAWLIWHLARIEDVAMNILVADSQQIYVEENWVAHLNSPYPDTGNGMLAVQISELSLAVDISVLQAYRNAVGQRTQTISRTLTIEDCKKKVDPMRIQRVREEGAVRPDAEGLLEYWGRRTIAGLLLMPPTRHNMVHLNEVSRLKKSRR
jgi:hypothetical protein